MLPSPTIQIVPQETDSSAKTYLALGDSYTIGQSVKEDDCFPNQAVARLREFGITINDPKVLAITGWTTADLLNSLTKFPIKDTFSIVSLLIGVNNQYQHTGIENYRTEFNALANLAVMYAGGIKKGVYILSIPDYSVTPFGQNINATEIAKEIDEFNFANKTIADQLNINYIDITLISRKGIAGTDYLATDGLHPSGKQYTQWADLLARQAQYTFNTLMIE